MQCRWERVALWRSCSKSSDPSARRAPLCRSMSCLCLCVYQIWESYNAVTYKNDTDHQIWGDNIKCDHFCVFLITTVFVFICLTNLFGLFPNRVALDTLASLLKSGKMHAWLILTQSVKNMLMWQTDRCTIMFIPVIHITVMGITHTWK